MNQKLLRWNDGKMGFGEVWIRRVIMGNKSESTGILENCDGFLWTVQFIQGHGVSVGIEDFEGKLVKVTRTQEKIIIEVIKEVVPVPWEQFHKLEKAMSPV